MLLALDNGQYAFFDENIPNRFRPRISCPSGEEGGCARVLKRSLFGQLEGPPPHTS